jgi:tetratricopeptide (TPR) repeat protein
MKHLLGMTTVAVAIFALFAGATRTCAQGTQTQSQTQSQQQQQPPAQEGQKPSLQNPITPAVAPVPAPVDPKEDAAYKSFFSMSPANPADVDKEIQAGEDFLKAYPASQYLQHVYSRLANAYFQKPDLAKMYEDGQKALALNGDDVSVLTLLGGTLPRGKADDPNFKDKLAQAEQYDKHALELLPTTTKPEGVTDEQFTKLKETATMTAHGGLGIALFREGKVTDAVPELEKATDGVTNPDPTDFYVLGLALASLQKYADAAKAFDGCAQLTSGLQDRCKQGSSDAKAKAANQLQPPKL